jgi:protein-tyrosine-phosphatase
VKRPQRMLAVCSGNTCRSPMAEAIARSLLGNSTVVESAGLDAVEGDCANKKAVAAMKEMGLNVEPHRTRNIRSTNANNYDLVVAMSPSIGRRLRELGVEAERLAELNVPDPYGTDVDAYRSTAKLIENELQRLFNNPPIDSRGKEMR